MKKSDFIKVPIEVVLTAEADLVGESNANKDLVDCMFLKSEMCGYRYDPAPEGLPEKVVIFMKSGYEVVAVLTMEEFEELIF